MCISCNAGLAALFESVASRRGFLKHAGLAATSAFVASKPQALFAQAAAVPLQGPADVIFRGGSILTMNSATPRAQAIAVRGGRIIAVGSEESVRAFGAPTTRMVDLKGRTLMPGMVEPHAHFVFVALDDWIDVGPMATPDFTSVWSKLHEGAGKAKEGDWIRAKQFDPSITKDARSPTLVELDALAPNNPFFMQEGNGHVAYVNSAAIKLAGITRDTPDPSGARFLRDSNGNFTGRIEESAAQARFFEKMPQPSALELISRVRRLFDLAASVGCTTFHDCGIGLLAGVKDLDLLSAVMAGNPPVRYRGMLISTLMDGWEKKGIQPGWGNDIFRVDGIKAWADGSNQAQTGYQRENYLGSGSRGALNYTLEQLTQTIRRAHEAGWQVGVHANGDAAIDTTIDAYESVLKDMPGLDRRHRIEHCSVLHEDQIARMKKLGLSPSFLIGHIHWWGKAFKDRILGPERAKFYDPCASALAGGLRISLHSDWNVTPIEPLRYVEDAVMRIMHEGGDVFFPEQRIPVDAALRAVTIDAAWQCHMDDKAGSLEVGKFADFAILEDDPTATSSRIGKIKVSETWLAGEQRYAA